MVDLCIGWNRKHPYCFSKGQALTNVGHRSLDRLTSFHMGKTAGVLSAPVRYAVRQVLDQECRKERLLQHSLSRLARSSQSDYNNLVGTKDDKENVDPAGKQKAARTMNGAKRDFFGRIINDVRPASAGKGAILPNSASKPEEDRVWVSFHEGYSNAVRKPITLKELMESF